MRTTPTTTKIVEYAYDHGQRWLRKTLDTNADGTIEESRIFVHDNGQIVLDFQKTGTAAAGNSDLAHRYLWSNSVDQLLADESVDDGSEEDMAWPLTDHLNSVRDLVEYDPVTQTVSVVKHLTYDAFGNVTSDSAPTTLTLFQFTTRPFDADSDLQNNLNRWYNLSTGRWMSVDPIGFEAGDVNLYRYVGNRSIVAVDPSGMVDISGWDLFGLDKAAIKQYIEDNTSYLEKAGMLASGKGTINITFTDQTDPDKLAWFGNMLIESLKSAGATEAAEHFKHFLDGTETPLPVKVGTFKKTKSYQTLLGELKRDCENGGNTSGTKSATEVVNDPLVHVLLGDYTYQWSMKKSKTDPCRCTVHFKVDDPYDFHPGKLAHFTHTKTVNVWGQDIEITATIGVPDSVLTNLQTVSGAKNVERVTE